MGIVDEDTELVFLLQLNNLVKESERSGHSIYTLCDEKDSSACLLTEPCSPLESLLTAFIVIMTVCHPLSHMQARTVDKAGMCLRVINDDIVTVHERVNSGKYSLISEIEKESVLFSLELCKLPLEPLVKVSMACHHAASHRVRKTPFRCSFGIRFSHLRMIRKPEIVVQAPA